MNIIEVELLESSFYDFVSQVQNIIYVYSHKIHTGALLSNPPSFFSL